MATDATHVTHAAPAPAVDDRAARVDGNALAGVLSALFAGDPTLLTLVCGHCARSGPLAEAAVERDETCAIVRCRGCTRTMLSVVIGPAGDVSVRPAALAELRSAASGA